jgi:hypothetical protein
MMGASVGPSHLRDTGEKYEWTEVKYGNIDLKRLPRHQYNWTVDGWQINGDDTEGLWYYCDDPTLAGVYRSQKNLNAFFCVPCDTWIHRTHTIRAITTHAGTEAHQRAGATVVIPDTSMQRVFDELSVIVEQALALNILENDVVQRRLRSARVLTRKIAGRIIDVAGILILGSAREAIGKALATTHIFDGWRICGESTRTVGA